MIIAIVCALVGWAFAAFLVVMHRHDLDDQRQAYEAALQVEQTRVNQLIAQVQANAQGLQHYPQIGPFPQEPEKQFLTDDTGLIVYELTDDDRDFADAADV